MGPGAGRTCTKRYPEIWALQSGLDGGDQCRVWRYGRCRSCSSTVKLPELGRVWATGVPGSPGLARIGEENPTNTLLGFWPRERGQKWENGGGRAPGGSGVTPARNPGHRERQSNAIGLGLALWG
jgi:hypothetical protein